jgi:hypothetical protein
MARIAGVTNLRCPYVRETNFLSSFYSGLALFRIRIQQQARDGILGTTILIQVSGHKLESSQTQVFIWFYTLIFPFYKMLFMNGLEFSGFADFL